MSDWKEEARKRKEEEEMENFCFIEADKQPGSDDDKRSHFFKCLEKRYEEGRAQQPVPPPPSPTPKEILIKRLDHCDLEAQKARTRKGREAFKKECYNETWEEYKADLAQLERKAREKECEKEALKAPIRIRPDFIPWCLADTPLQQSKSSSAYTKSQVVSPESRLPIPANLPLSTTSKSEDISTRFHVSRRMRKQVESRVETITRKFGLRFKGVEERKPGRKGPKSGAILPLPTFKADLLQVFREFQLVVNWMIKAGLELPDTTEVCNKDTGQLETIPLFVKEGKTAEMQFYHAVMRSLTIIKDMGIIEKGRRMDECGREEVERSSSKVKIRERLWRCAAEVAYYAVREVRTRQKLIPRLIQSLKQWVEERQQKFPETNLSVLFEQDFPQPALVRKVSEDLAKGDLALTPGQRSKLYLQNIYRHIRNIIKRTLGMNAAEVAKLIQVGSASLAESDIVAWLTTGLQKPPDKPLPDFVYSFLKTISSQMTKRVNYLRREQKRVLKREEKRKRDSTLKPYQVRLPFMRLSLDSQIVAILGLRGDPAVIQRIFTTLSRQDWEGERLKWRAASVEDVMASLGGFTVREQQALVQQAFDEAYKGFSVARFLAFIVNPRPRWVKYGGSSFSEFQKYLRAKAVFEIEQDFVEAVFRSEQFSNLIGTALKDLVDDLQGDSSKWLARPIFKKRTIPLGRGEEQVYELDMSGREVRVRLSFEPLKELHFLVQTQKRKGKPESDRFRSLTSTYGNDLVPKIGTVSLRPGGGLVLAIPFERQRQPQTTDMPIQLEAPIIGGAVDLGLITPAAITIAPIKRVETGGVVHWEPVGLELDRFFLDQRYLIGPYYSRGKTIPGERDTWLKMCAPSETKEQLDDTEEEKRMKKRHRRRKDIDPGFNWKRKLLYLQREVSKLQAKMTLYRNQFNADVHSGKVPKSSYRHKQKYYLLRRAWKRAWQKLRNLHLELTRQIATRVVAALQAKTYRYSYQGKEYEQKVQVVLLEDLSWARHRVKGKATYFLRSNQVHWFFGQVQQRIAALAGRAGILVEWIDSYKTSQRCAHCWMDARGTLHQCKKEKGKEEEESAKKKRKRKVFVCKQCGDQKAYRIDSDLNGARNILTAPIIQESPLL